MADEAEDDRPLPIARVLSRVAAGHCAPGGGAGIFVPNESEITSSAKSKRIIKPLDENEFEVYKQLSTTWKDDAVQSFIPTFDGVDSWVDSSGVFKRFIRMSNCLHGFDRAKVMDVKLGVRTFLESEASNPKLRKDLYEKMLKSFPDEITESERSAEAITKHRYMTLREKQSTIVEYGFRIDGAAGYIPSQSFKNFKTGLEIVHAFSEFVEVAADVNIFSNTDPLQMAKSFLANLRELREAMEASEFVAHHEIIGSSLLFIGDEEGHTGVYWIDFAKTFSLPEGKRLNHRLPWIQGNREDGILYGVDNIIEMWERCVEDRMNSRRFWRKLRGAVSFASAARSHKSDADQPLMGRVLSRIAAGHASKGGGGLYVPACSSQARPESVMKAMDVDELAVYEAFKAQYADDPLNQFIPKFEGVVHVITDDGGTEKSYIRMSNLLRDFESPKIVDIKLGARTFLESECTKPTLRPDLYERLVELYPSIVTEEDHAAKAITKFRWMSARDENSTIKDFAFRIDGAAGYSTRGPPFEAIRTKEEICQAFSDFITAVPKGCDCATCNYVSIATGIVEELSRLKVAFEKSSFIREHESIGSSLLLVVDRNGSTGVFWIDFAKTVSVPEGVAVTHLEPWQPGNHEDGILLGVRNLVAAWECVLARLKQADKSQETSLPSDESWVGLPTKAQLQRRRLLRASAAILGAVSCVFVAFLVGRPKIKS